MYNIGHVGCTFLGWNLSSVRAQPVWFRRWVPPLERYWAPHWLMRLCVLPVLPLEILSATHREVDAIDSVRLGMDGPSLTRTKRIVGVPLRMFSF